MEIVAELTNPLLCAMTWEEVSPAVASISPDYGPAAGGTAVTISGCNFTGATNVAFSSVKIAAAGFTVVDSSHITLSSPAATAGPVDVTVTTPWDTSAIHAGARFTYRVNPPDHPQLTISNPASNTIVPFVVTNCGVAGTSGGTATGTLVWSNALTLAAGTLPVVPSCSLPNLALGLGANVITVTATNLAGMEMEASITVTRRSYAWDSVGDGVSGAWRAQSFGGDGTTTNDNSSDARDPDRDGMSNLQEYVADTDPTNATSLFRIAPPRDLAEGVVSVPFISSANRLYSLEVSPILCGDWSAVPGKVDIPGTGGELRLSGASAPGAHFYRVRVRLPSWMGWHGGHTYWHQLRLGGADRVPAIQSTGYCC